MTKLQERLDQERLGQTKIEKSRREAEANVIKETAERERLELLLQNEKEKQTVVTIKQS